jgi:hypothetical protein
MSPELETAIKKLPNRADVVYVLAKSPELIAHLQKDPSKVGQLSADIERINRQASDPFYRRALTQEIEHNKRVQQALKGLPDAAAIHGNRACACGCCESGLRTAQLPHD